MQTPEFGALPGAAIIVDVQPAALLKGLTEVQDRMGTGKTDLGPLSEAWARARQAIEDGAASLLPTRASAPSLLAEWGIDAQTPIRVRVAAPEPKRMGRALIDVLTGRDVQDPPTVVAHLRARFGIGELPRMFSTLEVVASRIGLEVHTIGKGARPAWLGAEALPPEVRWLGRDPETGTWAALRVDGARAAFDVLVPPKPGPIAALLDGLKRATPTAQASPAPLTIQVRPAEYTGLEAALAAHVGLNHPKPAVREASAEVLAACTSGWRQVSQQVFAIAGQLQIEAGRPRVEVNAALTPAAVQAWTARQQQAAPLPIWGLAAWYVGWTHAAQGDGLDRVMQLADCAAGNLPVVGLVAGAMPDLLTGALPYPPILATFDWTGGIHNAAAAIVDVAAIDGAPVPVIAAAFEGGTGPGPQPLGPDAVTVEVDGETRWRAVGGVPVEIGHRGRITRVGLGKDALRPGLTTPADVLFAADIDAPALAARLKAIDGLTPEVRALMAVGERFGTLTVRVTRDGAALRLRAGFDP